MRIRCWRGGVVGELEKAGNGAAVVRWRLVDSPSRATPPTRSRQRAPPHAPASGRHAGAQNQTTCSSFHLFSSLNLFVCRGGQIGFTFRAPLEQPHAPPSHNHLAGGGMAICLSTSRDSKQGTAFRVIPPPINSAQPTTRTHENVNKSWLAQAVLVRISLALIPSK